LTARKPAAFFIHGNLTEAASKGKIRRDAMLGEFCSPLRAGAVFLRRELMFRF
jgi:hypothetical protein